MRPPNWPVNLSGREGGEREKAGRGAGTDFSLRDEIRSDAKDLAVSLVVPVLVSR